MPGAEWKNQIDEHIETAHIILLLISAEFINSDYCYDVELKRAIARHDAGEARVIPIILRPCDWLKTPLENSRRFRETANRFPIPYAGSCVQ
jgi:internalin A